MIFRNSATYNIRWNLKKNGFCDDALKSPNNKTSFSFALGGLLDQQFWCGYGTMADGNFWVNRHTYYKTRQFWTRKCKLAFFTQTEILQSSQSCILNVIFVVKYLQKKRETYLKCSAQKTLTVNNSSRTH